MRLDGLASSWSSAATLRNMGLNDASESFTMRLVNACRQHPSTSSTADDDSCIMKKVQWTLTYPDLSYPEYSVIQP